MRPSEQGYLVIIELLLKIFAALAKEYMASSVQIFITLAAWKCDSSFVVNSSTRGQLASSQALFIILANWKCYSLYCQETLESKVSCFRCVTPAFWRPENVNPKLKRTRLLLKAFKTFWRSVIRFLKDHETHRRLSIHIALRNPLFGILVAWKRISSKFMRSLAEEEVAYGGQLFIISETWKSDYLSVFKSTTPGYVMYYLTFWQHEYVLLQRSCEPRIKDFIEVLLNN